MFEIGSSALMRSDPAISEYSVFNDTSDDIIISVNDFLWDRRQTERPIQKTARLQLIRE